MADALLIELYATTVREAEDGAGQCVFATSNYQDFSVPNGDRRKPHPDLARFFHEHSHYTYEVGGLVAILTELIGDEYTEIAEEVDFVQEDTRSLLEILEAEEEYFDRIWYVRSIAHIAKAQRTCCQKPIGNSATGTASLQRCDGS